MAEDKKEKSGFFSRLVQLIIPPPKWRVTVLLLTGILFGLLVHIFYVSNAVSYLSDDPSTCINCHVMTSYHATWERGSHGRVTTCNDCHVPQDNFLKKYFFKATDGLRHATMFTFRLEPQVIQIKDAGKHAVQQNCIRCHTEQVHPVAMRAFAEENIIGNNERFCWDCHRETPHGRVNSLASTPYARVPVPGTVMPEWVQKYTNSNTEIKKESK